MNQTVIGYFDNNTAAEQARRELLQAGFTDSHVTVQAGGTGATAGSSDTMGSSTPTDVTARTSMTAGTTATGTGDYGSASYSDNDRHSGIGGFFRSLFGLDDNDTDVGFYSEAMRRGGSLVTVDVNSDDQMQRAEEILQRCGAVDVDERAQQWRSEGWAGASAGTASLASGNTAGRTDVSTGDARATIPVVQEELRVGKREVRQGGLRVYTRLVETPVSEVVRLRQEQATIQRRAVDRPATEADFAALKEGSIEVRETSEEAVVSKVARVTEEIEVGKQVTEREQTVSDTVRHTDVRVEQLEGGATTGTTSTTGLAGTTGTTAGTGMTGTTGTSTTPLAGSTSGNVSQARGQDKQAEGAAKDAQGAATGRLGEQLEGKLEKAAGKVQEGYGNLKDDLKGR